MNGQELINSLRNGTVPQGGLNSIAIGIDEEVAELQKELKYIESGQSSVRFIQGEYGAGKTFLTSRISEIALSNNFVVTRVVIKPGISLGKFREIYHELTVGLKTAKSGKGSGFIDIFDSWSQKQFEKFLKIEGIKDLSAIDANIIKRFQESIEFELAKIRNLDTTFSRAVALYASTKLEKNAEKSRLIVEWLRGNENIVASKYSKELGLKGKFSDTVAYEFLKGLLFLSVDTGYSGILLVFDEVETIRWIPQSNIRKNSYERIRSFLDDVADGNLKNILFLITATPEFFEDRKGIREYPALYDRIADPKSVQGNSIRQPIIKLKPLGEGDIYKIGSKIRDLHGHVYNWQPNNFIDESQMDTVTRHLGTRFGEVKANPRNFLRAMVKVLDIAQKEPDKKLAAILPQISLDDE